MKIERFRYLFALLRSALVGAKLSESELEQFSDEQIPELSEMAQKHDVGHLLAYGLKLNGLITREEAQKSIYKAVIRCERINYELEQVCAALEKAHIQFLPLKGSVLRKYYPEEWMRTSCDIDILVHCEDLDMAVDFLTENLNYNKITRTKHDVCFFSPIGVSVELHFDLLEEGRANNAISVLSSVWQNVKLCENSKYRYEMSDSFFYFYHIAHMAKHFESGGCGIRPFIDLWILDNLKDADKAERDKLLSDGKLLDFANASRKLSNVWFETGQTDGLMQQMQTFILCGGVFGSRENKVAVQQKKRGGQLGYLISRIFVPYSQLKRYYPVLDKHRYLFPLMQIRRWFMLINPEVAEMARNEMVVNTNITKEKADEMNTFLQNIGLK